MEQAAPWTLAADVEDVELGPGGPPPRRNPRCALEKSRSLDAIELAAAEKRQREAEIRAARARLGSRTLEVRRAAAAARLARRKAAEARRAMQELWASGWG